MTLSQNSLPKKESTITRQTRNAFLSAALLALTAAINLITTLRVSMRAPSLLTFLDTSVVLLFVIVAVYSAVMIRNGKKKKGVWVLLVSFVVTLGIRNALISDLGIVFALLAATVVPLVGLLSLRPDEFKRALGLGLFASALYLLFDTLATRLLEPYRQMQDTVHPIAVSITVLAILLAIIYLIAIWRQRRYMLLSSKLILVMISVVLAPVVMLSWANAVSLKSILEPRQTQTMAFKANFLSQNIETFIKTTKDTLNKESQLPIFITYLGSSSDERQGSSIQDSALKTLETFLGERSNIKSYALLDLNGINRLDTKQENIGADESKKDYFIAAVQRGAPYVSDISREVGSTEYSFYFSAPVKDENGNMLGVLRTEYDLQALSVYIDAYIKLEQAEDKEVFAALLAEEKVPQNDTSIFLVLASSKSDELELNFHSITPLTTSLITPLQMEHILPVGSAAQFSLHVPGLDEGLRNRTEKPTFNAQAFPRDNITHSLPLDVIAADDVSEENLPWIVITAQDLKSYNAPFQQQADINTILAIFVAGAAALLAYFGSQYLTHPILEIAHVAKQISEGDLEARVAVNSEDEIGALANAFNSMTRQLSHLVETLETRVAERTEELERTAGQLRAAVEVGKAAASFRSLDELLSQATTLISRQFGFYHAGIFLLDPQGEYALLRAANSTGGKRMLARGHKLKVGETGIVGYVTSKGEARIALDVGQDATYFNNPDLPETRSEMALPLIAGGRVLGALDIQSTEGEAFKERDIVTLQVLADQLAIAIQNARLFEQNRKALINLQKAYGEQSELGWRELIRKSDQIGYRTTEDGTIYDIDKTMPEEFDFNLTKEEVELSSNGLIAHIPIMVRGQSIGMMRLVKPDNARSWEEQELNLAQVLATELSKAMDSARLFDETREQADLEHVVGEISERMRETMNVETVAKLAADEFYKLLDLEDITINLSTTDGAEETA